MVGLATLALGCPGRNAVQCDQDSSCNLSSSGRCIMGDTGSWCAYPDPACPSGYRYSDQRVGGGVSGECVADVGDDGGMKENFKLTVRTAGSGSGSVTTTPGDMTCGAGPCEQTFAAGTRIMLTATPATGAFLGWTGACTGMSACAVTIDRDISITAMFGTPGEALWSLQIGGTMQDIAKAVRLDSDGNLIVAGEFQNTFPVGSTTLTSQGSIDIFVAKVLASDGSVAWIKQFGGAGAEAIGGIALDSANNIYVAGTFTGSVNFGNGAITPGGGGDGYALKLDNAGAFQWVKQIGGSGSDGGNGIAVSGSNVAVVGTYTGSMTVNGVNVSNGGASTAYLVGYGTDGSAGIVKTFPGTGNSNVNNVVFDSSGNIILGGSLSGSADFGNGTKTSMSGDAFFAKYTPAGAYLVAMVLGGSGNDSGASVSVDPADNIFVAGAFTGSVAFGGPSPVNANSGNLVVAKYSSAGAYKWAQPFGGTTATIIPRSIAANSAGDVVAAGSFCGSATFSATAFIASVGTCASNDYDIFAVRLAGVDGSALSATRAGGSQADMAYAVVQTNDGRHFAVGSFQGFADFGGTSRTSAGGMDAIVLGLAPL